MDISSLIAHRGASKYAPENTLSALQHAYEMGVKWVEFDVQLSRDDKLVVIHDELLERTTGQAGFVYDYSLQELKLFDAGSFFAKEYKGARIPTFREWISQANQFGLALNIELKPAKAEHRDVLIESVIAELNLFWPSAPNELLISSFDRICLEEFHRIAPEYKIASLFHEWDDSWLSVAEKIDAVSVNVNCDVLTEQRAAEIKAQRFKLLSYTVNQKALADKLFSWGVDGVFSDDPNLLG